MKTLILTDSEFATLARAIGTLDSYVNYQFIGALDAWLHNGETHPDDNQLLADADNDGANLRSINVKIERLA